MMKQAPKTTEVLSGTKLAEEYVTLANLIARLGSLSEELRIIQQNQPDLFPSYSMWGAIWRAKSVINTIKLRMGKAIKNQSDFTTNWGSKAKRR